MSTHETAVTKPSDADGARSPPDKTANRNLSAILSTSRVSYGSDLVTHADALIQAYATHPHTGTNAPFFTLALDISPSMESDGLMEPAKTSVINYLTEIIRPTAGVVRLLTFATQWTVLTAEPIPLDTDEALERVCALVRAVEYDPTGSTNLGDVSTECIRWSAEALDRSLYERSAHIILFTDGLPTSGPCAPEQATELALEHTRLVGDRQIALSTIALGDQPSREFLEPITTGRFGFAPTTEHLFEAFKTVSGDLLSDLNQTLVIEDGDGPRRIHVGAVGPLHTELLLKIRAKAVAIPEPDRSDDDGVKIERVGDAPDSTHLAFRMALVTGNAEPSDDAYTEVHLVYADTTRTPLHDGTTNVPVEILDALERETIKKTVQDLAKEAVTTGAEALCETLASQAADADRRGHKRVAGALRQYSQSARKCARSTEDGAGDEEEHAAQLYPTRAASELLASEMRSCGESMSQSSGY